MKTVSRFAFILAVCGGGLNTALAQEPDDGGGRVTICHRPGTPAQKTLTLPRKAAERHIARHGDTLGACPQDAYEVITEGLLGNPPFPIQFQTASLRLEVRDLIMGPGEAEAVPTPMRTIMELRGGSVITTINGHEAERLPGDFWEVGKGDALSLENGGDVAVIRAIYVFEGDEGG